MHKKYSLLLLILISIFYGGCAVTVPQSIQKTNIRFNQQLEFFKQAKGLSFSEIPKLYDISYLKPGSRAKTRYVYGIQNKPFFTTQVLRDIQSDGAEKSYLVDLNTGGDKIFTFRESALGLSTIICPEDFNFETMDFKEPQRDNLPTAIVRNAIIGGPIGLIVDLWHNSYMKDLDKEIIQSLKGQKIKTKIIGLSLISNENLKIANKTIACKVYQVSSMTCQTRPGTKRCPGITSLIEETAKIWISDGVPFGVAKREGVQILHMRLDSNNRISVQMADPKPQELTSEVVEFSY